MSQGGAPNRKQRRAMVKGMGAGVVLDRQTEPEDGTRRYPLIIETILHHCGVAVMPMEEGALMLRFPTAPGTVFSVPLSSEGVDELLVKIEEARALQQVDPSATVEEDEET